MNKRKNDLNRILYIISAVLFAALAAYLCFVIRTRSNTGLDSDMSSELILAKMLKEEGRILTPNWYYGTELRILYYTQISALLFNITDNWYMVRVYSDIIMLVILSLSVLSLSYRLGLKKYYPVLGLILLLPFSDGYYRFVLYGAYYIPCIATSFFAMAMILHYVQTDDRRAGIILLSGSGLLATASSLIGYRQVVMFYLPAFMGAAVMILFEYARNKQLFAVNGLRKLSLITFIDLVCAGLGCAINSLLLIRLYPVEDWNKLNFTEFNMERFVDTVCGMIRNLGYREEKIGIGTLISNGYSSVLFIVFIIAVCHAIAARNKSTLSYLFGSLYVTCAMALLLLLNSFTDMDMLDRYSAPLIVFIFPVVIMYIDQINIEDVKKTALALIIGISACIVSVHGYKEINHNDRTIEHREIAGHLVQDGFETGYATFWNANVMTELSNGILDMYNWETEIMLPCIDSVDNVMPWLQKVSHTYTRPAGKVFQLFDRSEIYFCPWKESLSDDRIIYETENYVVYAYPSYEEMKAECIIPDSD